MKKNPVGRPPSGRVQIKIRPLATTIARLRRIARRERASVPMTAATLLDRLVPVWFISAGLLSCGYILSKLIL